MLSEATLRAYPSVDLTAIQAIDAFEGRGSQKIFFYEAFHRGGFGYQLSACWCPGCIRGVRIGAFKRIKGCSSGEDLEYKILKRTDPAWVADTKSHVNNLGIDISRSLRIGDIVAYDPLLSPTSRRLYRFDIGEIVNNIWPHHYEVNPFVKSESPFIYVRKNIPKRIIIFRNDLRYKFIDIPIIQNIIQHKIEHRIILTDEILIDITKNFYNGS